jgi:hypothetical protein
MPEKGIGISGAVPRKGEIVIIDSHVHLKHGGTGQEFTAEQIVRYMDAVGMARSVVFAMSTTTQHSLEMAEEAVARFPDRLVPYAYALPHYERPVLRELEQAVSEKGFRGIKMHIGECSLAPYIVDPVFDLAGRLGVPCLIDFSGHVGLAESLAKRFPNTKLIIAHFGRYLCTDIQLLTRVIELAEACPNVYIEISGVVLLAKITEAVQRIGAERVIWGTDGPNECPDPAAFDKSLAYFVAAEIAKVKAIHLDPADERMVLGGSIAALLGI